MPNSPVYRLRIEPRLKRLIDARRGSEPLSAWLRRAASQRLEAEQGLGPEPRRPPGRAHRPAPRPRDQPQPARPRRQRGPARGGEPADAREPPGPPARDPDPARRDQGAVAGVRAFRMRKRGGGGQRVSAAAERLFDDYWFVLARTGRARGPGGADPERPARAGHAQVPAERGPAQAPGHGEDHQLRPLQGGPGRAPGLHLAQRPERGLRPGGGEVQRHRRPDGPRRPRCPPALRARAGHGPIAETRRP